MQNDETRVPLPNDKWIRSPKKPDWALCLDPEAKHYGWKMYECNGAWVSSDILSLREIDWALTESSLREQWPAMRALRTHLTGAQK